MTPNKNQRTKSSNILRHAVFGATLISALLAVLCLTLLPRSQTQHEKSSNKNRWGFLPSRGRDGVSAHDAVSNSAHQLSQLFESTTSNSKLDLNTIPQTSIATFDVQRRLINFYATNLSGENAVIPPFPQWVILSDRYGGRLGGDAPAFRSQLMRDPYVCKDKLERVAIWNGWDKLEVEDTHVGEAGSRQRVPKSNDNPSHTCEWFLYNPTPLDSESPEARVFAQQTYEHIREEFGVNLKSEESLSNVLGCISENAGPLTIINGQSAFQNGTTKYVCKQPLAPKRLRGFADVLASTYVPPGTIVSVASLSSLLTRAYIGGGILIWDWMGLSDLARRFSTLTAESILHESIYHAKDKSIREMDLSQSSTSLLSSLPADFEPLPFHQPSPSVLSALSPSSPLVTSVLSTYQMRYFGDDEPRILNYDPEKSKQEFREIVKRPLANVLSPLEIKQIRGFGAEHRTAIEDYRKLTSGRMRYMALSSQVKSLRDRLTSSEGSNNTNITSITEELQKRIPIDLYDFPYSAGQLLVTMTDRIVRSGPSGNAFYSNIIESGIRSAVKEAGEHEQRTGAGERSDDISDQSLNNIPGSIYAASSSENVKTSTIDAMAGTWNMSDIPDWLRIPSVVSVPGCLDPLNEAPRGAGRKERFVPGDDLYEDPKSVLIIGPSHARNIFTSLCSQYVFGITRESLLKTTGTSRQKAFADRASLCDLPHGHDVVRILRRDEIPGMPSRLRGGDLFSKFPLAFGWSSMDPFRMIERLISQLLGELKLPPPQSSTDKRRELQQNKDDVVQEMAYNLPIFTEESATDSENRSFAYTNFLLRIKRGDFAQLRGIFSHVIFVSGVWEASYRDGSFPEIAESMAITLDMIEEVFAPQKIIRYDPHRWWPSDGRRVRPTPEFYDRSELDRMDCKTHQNFARYRDAHMCGAFEPMRSRVRKAWSAEEHHIRETVSVHEGSGTNGNTTRRAHRTRHRTHSKFFLETDLAHGVNRRSIIELFDPTPATSDSLGLLFTDINGHHYKGVVIEAMSQRILRDHVCPPRFVIAKKRRGGNDKKKPQLSQSSGSGRPRVNYANSLLPDNFPFPGGVDTVLIRVRNSRKSADLMPSLHVLNNGQHRTPFFEIHNLFPLFKMPIAVVNEGLCRAIFDHPLSEINNMTRAVTRNHTITASMEDAMVNEEQMWWRAVDPGMARVDSPPAPFPKSSPHVKTHFPLEVHHPPYLATFSFNNPYVPNHECLFIHPRRLIKSEVFKARERFTNESNSMELSKERTRKKFTSPGDSSYARLVFPVYTTPRHNIDPMYLLRTVSYNLASTGSIECSCAVSRQEASDLNHLDVGMAYPTHTLPFEVRVPRKIFGDKPCALPPHEELRARMVVRAYIENKTKIMMVENSVKM